MALPDARALSVPWLRIAVSCVLGAAIVAALWPLMAAVPADPWIGATPLLLYGATLVPFHLIRAGRWWFLLRQLGPIRPRESIAIGLVGYMWIALLPLRLGELARPVLVAQRHGIAVGRTLAVVAVERIADGLVVVGMFALTHDRGGDDELGGAVRIGATVTAGFFATVLGGLVVLARWPQVWSALARWFGRGPLTRVVAAADRLVTPLAEGLVDLADRRAWPGFVLGTLAYWACNILGTWQLAVGCGLSITPADAVLVTAVMNLAMTIPGGPAQLGVFQGGVAAGVILVAGREVLHAQGAVFGFWLYACQLASITLAGLVAARVLGVRWDVALGGLTSRSSA
jgi:glycosyltransferase 2 family protein